MQFLLLCSAFVIATCGLVYELISGTLASYLLGDSVTQFSTIIGVYLFSMGIGSYLSRFFNRNLIAVFIKTEFLIGLIGGSTGAILFLLFPYVESFRLLLYALVAIVGMLVGLEIPLLLRVLQDHFEFKDLVSKVLTFDYIGALVASLLFPLILVPYLGLIRSGFFFGILNVVVALAALSIFKEEIRWVRTLRLGGFFCLAVLLAGFIYSERITSFAEQGQYPDKIVYARSTSYQRMIVTQQRDDIRLYLNSNLQFSSRDEYRYHEALIHPTVASVPHPQHVLVLGGGDGMAVRELLKWDNIVSIQLVDLDPAMIRLFSSDNYFRKLNHDSLLSPRVHITNADAFLWLKNNPDTYDVIVVDFPDPSNYSLSKLFTTAFFRLVSAHLAPEGSAVIQSTSPLVARQSYWCIDATLRATGFLTTPYHAYVPAFGEWGFIIARHEPFQILSDFPPGLRYLNADTFSTMLNFPQDMSVVAAQVNTLNNQILVQYFEKEWADYAH